MRARAWSTSASSPLHVGEHRGALRPLLRHRRALGVVLVVGGGARCGRRAPRLIASSNSDEPFLGVGAFRAKSRLGTVRAVPGSSSSPSSRLLPIRGIATPPTSGLPCRTRQLRLTRGHRPLPPLSAGDVRRDDRPVAGDRSAACTALRTDRVEPRLPVQRAPRLRQDDVARASWPAASTAPRARPTPRAACATAASSSSRDGGGSLDVVEIDAASHNGVDDARDLRERAVFAPARDRYKIFILDEAHMVTPQGFNALLKIVEEPPEHVKFIFATTEPEKVIGTIRSRTHHYPFRLVPPAQMLEYVQQLCDDRGRRRSSPACCRSSCAPAAARCATRSRCSTSSSPAPRARPSSTSAPSRCSATPTARCSTRSSTRSARAMPAGAFAAVDRVDPDRPGPAPLRRRPARAPARPHRRRGDEGWRGRRAARRARRTSSTGC